MRKARRRTRSTTRDEAAARLARGATALGVSPTSTPAEMLHELHVHQAELEVQNEELRRHEAERERRIAELEEINQRLAETQHQLLQADKMAAIGQLAAGVAHELSGPLSYLKSNLQAIGERVTEILAALDLTNAGRRSDATRPDAAPNELGAARLELKEDLEESRHGLERVSQLVNDIRAFAHPGSGTRMEVDLRAILDCALRILDVTNTRDVRLVRDHAAVPLPVLCLPSQLEQVFMNVLLNAIQASTEGGTVTVRTGRADAAAWVEVEDTGAGIAPENLGRIFEPFFTTKPVGVGTGLGLSIAHGIVGAHGGRIEVRNRPGLGAIFRVTLPLGTKPVAG